jgi:acyl-CoA reductase-like NAD-dependent aldehyde dehydrogenase
MMGENCDACERIYIHEDIYDEFVAAFVETVEGFVVGDPLDEDT